jgi:hypothetical protein
MTNATMTPTYDTGATGKFSPVVSVPPDRRVDDDTLSAQLPDLGMNMPFIADTLSAMLAHERCGLHLYRSAAGRTLNPVLKAKYEKFGDETARHAEILHELIAEMGGDPRYVSPAARATEGMDTKLLESTFLLAGSVDLITAERVLLDAVLVAETVDHANWTAMAELVGQLPDGDLRDSMADAVAEVLSEEHDHLGWARDTRTSIVTILAASGATGAAMATVEDLTARVRDWFS